ncbi:putative enzyme [Desulfamplus magnetovallimortis]|uniref:Putative enzyme n=1 Tax=Desulfamplus magnetovallimortis TaxID=1246637 RepID=A0A1W1HKJ4_9BACT|nr:signal peptide peptidase SppA [Desulfamplus magnetovallimortis]SLM32989.1 putative enzyme [Desulfamplus magnetovallimortis]
MFSRRHPYLYFIMVSCAIGSIFMISAMGIIVGGGAALVNSGFAGIEKKGEGNVGIVEINGAIISSKEIIDQIKDFREKSSIKAIVVRINSPGGSVGPSQEIYREIIKTRKFKTVIASLGSVAASGGYYAASSCDGIMANPGTITGSIGVIMEYANFQELAEKIGLSPVVIKSGEFKDIGSPMREISENERSILQGVVDEIHMQFVRDAALGRNIETESMAKYADGRIYTGESALDLQLIDRLGNLDDAVEWAGEIAGIEGKVKAVYPEEDKAEFLRKLVQSLLKNADISSALSNYFRFIIN